MLPGLHWARGAGLRVLQLEAVACCALLGCLCALPLCALTCADESLAIVRLRGRSAEITRKASAVLGYGHTRAEGEACPARMLAAEWAFRQLLQITYGPIQATRGSVSALMLKRLHVLLICRCTSRRWERVGAGALCVVLVRPCIATTLRSVSTLEAPTGLRSRVDASLRHCDTWWYVFGAL